MAANRATLTRDEVARIAGFARLELSADEIERMTDELDEILAHVAILDEVDIEGVEPMTHAVELELRTRPDDVTESLAIDEVLAGAPDEEDAMFAVPSSLGGSS
jgi:aspartyl-tRNA(Asn)/glutamyl-tRNA(Gln) amidotransferase subunit C